MENSSILLVWHRYLERSLVLVRVEFLTGWVELLHAVLLQSCHQDVVGHLESTMKVDKILIVRSELLSRNSIESTIKVVNAIKQVFRETLQGEFTGCCHLALRLLLQVPVFCNLAF